MSQKYYSASTNGFYDSDIHETMPGDAVAITDEKWLSLITGQSEGKVITSDNDGNPVLADQPERTNEEIQAFLTAVIQGMLDEEAKSHGYGSILSLVSYVGSSVQRFADEADAGKLWRDQVWDKANEILNDVNAGNRAIPTEEELLAELPDMVWPA